MREDIPCLPLLEEAGKQHLYRLAGTGQMQESAALRCLKGDHNWETMGECYVL